MTLVFLALGSIGDTLPLAVVAAEAAHCLQLSSPPTHSVALLTHAQHLPRLRALTVHSAL